jgi:hypothetical protein
MSSIKDTILNIFSKNQKRDNKVSSEIQNEVEIKETTEDEAERIVNSAAHADIDTDPEWEKRILCSDGNCIGVIGPEGCCRECGKPYTETEKQYVHGDNENELYNIPPSEEELKSDEADFSSENPEALHKTSDESTEEKGLESEPELEMESESEWDNRKLCSDGNCIGVIGPDGLCKECGTPYEE